MKPCNSSDASKRYISPGNMRWNLVLSGNYEISTDFCRQGDAYQDSNGCQAGNLEHFEILTLSVPKVTIFGIIQDDQVGSDFESSR